jgi:hypothetical protein
MYISKKVKTCYNLKWREYILIKCQTLPWIFFLKKKLREDLVLPPRLIKIFVQIYSYFARHDRTCLQLHLHLKYYVQF